MTKLSHEYVINAFAEYSQQFEASRDKLAPVAVPEIAEDIPEWRQHLLMPYRALEVWKPYSADRVPQATLSKIKLIAPDGDTVRRVELQLYNADPGELALEMHYHDTTIRVGDRESMLVRKAPHETMFSELDEPAQLHAVLRKSLGMLAWIGTERFPGGMTQA